MKNHKRVIKLDEAEPAAKYNGKFNLNDWAEFFGVDLEVA